jgi:hypothetical protein
MEAEGMLDSSQTLAKTPWDVDEMIQPQQWGGGAHKETRSTVWTVVKYLLKEAVGNKAGSY